jgi:MEKHLA domain
MPSNWLCKTISVVQLLPNLVVLIHAVNHQQLSFHPLILSMISPSPDLARDRPVWQSRLVTLHVQRLLKSFQHWTGKPLLDMEQLLNRAENTLIPSPEEQAEVLFNAPFVVVSHGAEPDPILNYGNRKALELWEMDWQQFTQTPSRLTAEPIAQAERSRLLQATQENGFICNYHSIRISSTGKRFWIRDVMVWNVLDEMGIKCGQAAMFERWEPISI